MYNIVILLEFKNKKNENTVIKLVEKFTSLESLLYLDELPYTLEKAWPNVPSL